MAHVIHLKCDTEKLRRWYRHTTGIRAQLEPHPMDAVRALVVEFLTRANGFALLKVRKPKADYFSYYVEFPGPMGTVREYFVLRLNMWPVTDERLAFCRELSNALTNAEEDELDVFTSKMDEGAADESPFAPEEKKLLISSLARAQSEIQERFAPTDKQMNDIKIKIEYLTEKVEELGRFSWKRLFISILVAIAVDLFKSTLIPKTLLEAFGGVVRQLFENLKLIEPPKK